MAAIYVGAMFVLTPTFDIDTVEARRARSVPVICGCATPIEMVDANRVAPIWSS